MKQIYYQPILTREEWETGELSSFMVYRSLANAKEDYPKHVIAAYEDGDIEDPTFVDDEDFRTPIFYVDIPQQIDGKLQEEWVNLETFLTRDEAIQYAKEHLGADDNGMISVISQS